MSETKKPETEKKATRKPRAVRTDITRVMVNLSNEHYAKLEKYARDEEREPGAQLSLLIRRNFASLIGETREEERRSFSA